VQLSSKEFKEFYSIVLELFYLIFLFSLVKLARALTKVERLLVNYIIQSIYATIYVTLLFIIYKERVYIFT
jgi:hypothetical protein